MWPKQPLHTRIHITNDDRFIATDAVGAPAATGTRVATVTNTVTATTAGDGGGAAADSNISERGS